MTFTKGVSGNPNGRPRREKTYQTAARELLASNEIKITFNVRNGSEVVKKTIDISSDHNMYYALAATMIIEGLKGNHQAVKDMIDRTEGRPNVKDVDETKGDLIARLSQYSKEELNSQINDIQHRRKLLAGSSGP